MRAELEVFEYPAVAAPDPPSWEAFSTTDVYDAPHRPEATGAERAAAAQAVYDGRAVDLARSFEAGLAQGLEEGRSVERQTVAAAAKDQELHRAAEAARLVESFHAQRTQYFESVEAEVARLALAIAARILRREAQMDPLLLSGAVRVALRQLSASTEVRLRVPDSDLDLWRDTIAHLPNLAVKPSVVAGEGMHAGECALEAELGSVDLGLGAQLAEIERKFFDGTGLDLKETEEDMSE